MKTIKKIPALIIDDELHGRENLKKLIETYCTEVEVIGTAESVVSAWKQVDELNPDVVFLDINMPVLDGFDFLKEFDERNFFVVFVSAHNEYGIKAVKAGAVDYLLKPIEIKELKETVKKLILLHNKKLEKTSNIEKDKLILPATHGFSITNYNEIVRLEADGCYTNIFMKEGKNKVVTRTLKEFEDTLPKDKFFRIHKSHLINLNFIKDYSNIGGFYVTMNDGSKIEVSRRKAPDFIKKLKTKINAV